MVDVLRLRAREFPEGRALTYGADGISGLHHLTYGELDQQARAIAAELIRLGLTGERALLLYPSGLEVVTAFFGCLYAGVVAVPAYPPRRSRKTERLDGILADSGAKIVLSSAETLPRMDKMVSPEAALRRLPWLATDALATKVEGAWRGPDIDTQSLAFLQYTSGSTGNPKGVMVTHANLLTNSRLIAQGFKTAPTDVGFFWLPLYHDMGLIGGILQPLYSRIPAVLMSPAHFLQKPLRWLQAISAHGATISGGPNFAYDLCVDRITDDELRQLDLSHWELAFNGAEPIRACTLQRFAKRFAPCGFRPEAFYSCYGLAEATLMVTGSTRLVGPTVRPVTNAETAIDASTPAPQEDSAAPSLAVASGRGNPDQQVRIVNTHTLRECPEGEVGEIWVSGPCVAAGYWKRPEENERLFAATLPGSNDRFLRTGDLGFLTDGELYVTGRCKDVIILRGVNHYPTDIEQTVEAVCKPRGAGRCAAFAIPTVEGERLAIALEITRGSESTKEELLDLVRSRVAENHDVTPAAIALVANNSLPLTSSGKLQRYACRQAFLEGKLRSRITWIAQSTLRFDDPEPPAAGASQTSGSDEVRQAVFAAIRRVANERADRLTEDSSLVGLGLDSLERMEIAAQLEDQFGGRFSEEAMLEMETAGDVVAAVSEHLLGAHAKSPVSEVTITPGDYDFAESPEYQRLLENISLTAQSGIDNPYFTVHEGITSDRTTIAGREYLNFCSYNYLGMSGDPVVIAAAQEATRRYGTSVSASRLVSGEKPLHRQLEQAIAQWLGVDDAITMVGGHATNETTIGHLFGPADLILHDALAHNSVVQGCRLSGARRRAFPHNDFGACAELLQRYRHEHRRVLIVIEGVYSMDGDIAPLAEFVRLKEAHKAYLMVDEAHSLGTLGEGGRGIASHAGIDPRRVDLWMGTLSKSLGSCGGYIAARKEIVEYLRYTAPGFVYSVGMTPANAGAALAALEQLERHPERVARLAKNAELFLDLAQCGGLDTGASYGTPIIPVITGSSLLALQLADRLFQDGINVQPILHPAVEERAARLRYFLTSDHSDEQIRRAVARTVHHWQQLSAAAAAAA